MSRWSAFVDRRFEEARTPTGCLLMLATLFGFVALVLLWIALAPWIVGVYVAIGVAAASVVWFVYLLRRR